MMMKARVENGVLHLEGTPEEIALYERARAGSPEPPRGSTPSKDRRVVPRQAASDRPDAATEILRQVRRLSPQEVRSFVKDHPAATVEDFVRQFVGNVHVGATGATRSAYNGIYNRLARAREALGLQAPTKEEA